MEAVVHFIPIIAILQTIVSKLGSSHRGSACLAGVRSSVILLAVCMSLPAHQALVCVALNVAVCQTRAGSESGTEWSRSHGCCFWLAQGLIF